MRLDQAEFAHLVTRVVTRFRGGAPRLEVGVERGGRRPTARCAVSARRTARARRPEIGGAACGARRGDDVIASLPSRWPTPPLATLPDRSCRQPTRGKRPLTARKRGGDPSRRHAWLVHAAEEKRVFRADRHNERRVDESAGLAGGEQHVADRGRAHTCLRARARIRRARCPRSCLCPRAAASSRRSAIGVVAGKHNRRSWRSCPGAAMIDGHRVRSPPRHRGGG